MKRRARPFGVLAACLLLGSLLNLACAQEAQDGAFDIPVLERYNEAVLALGESTDLLGSDPGASAASLERAENAARTLLSETRSDALQRGLLATFEQARTALARRSLVDLQVQTAVIRGGLQRIVYESALVQAASGDLAQAQDKADRLGRDLGFSETRQDAFAHAGSLAQLLVGLEQGVGDVIGAHLAEVRALPSDQREAAFLALADGYAAFILIQDSLHAREDATDVFVAAFAALQQGDREALEARLDDLDRQLAALAAPGEENGVSASTEPAAATLDIVVDPEEAAGQDAPSEQASNDAVTEAAEGVSEGVGEGVGEEAGEAPSAQLGRQPSVAPANGGEATLIQPVLATPFGTLPPSGSPGATRAPSAAAPSSDATDAAAPPATLLLEVTPALAVRTDLRAAAPGPAPAGTRAALLERLASPLLGADAAARLADAYQAAGFAGPEALVDSLYSRAARLVAALSRGASDEARGLLVSLRGDLEGLLAPLNAEAARAADTLRRLELAPILRPQDAGLVVAAVDRVALSLAAPSAAPSGLLAEADALVGVWWPGLLRMALVLSLALLAFYPLYLLNLAFGSGNRSWRWVALALLSLLLPIMYEGFAYASLMVTEAAGLPALATLSVTSPLGDALWAAITALAIVFASVGLYGICRQFGLRGADARRVRAPAAKLTRGRGADGDEL